MATVKRKARTAYLSAAEAVELLGVRHQTLYAYVSRGQVRSMAQPGSRERLYSREDIERVQLRSRARSRPEAMAATLLDRGHPVVPTSITDITPEGPNYRGHPAVALARRHVAFEQVAELLWTGMWHEDRVQWPDPPAHATLPRLLKGMSGAAARLQLSELFALVVMHLSMGRGAVRQRLVSGRPLEAGREIIQVLTGCFGFLRDGGAYVPPRPGRCVAESVLLALGQSQTPDDVELLEATLVLLADHELSPGTFAARVAASAGCSLHSCVSAAILASSGTEVTLRYERVEQLLDGAGSARELVEQARRLTGSAQAVPGFEHPLYPLGDPRAAHLLQAVRERGSLPRPAARLLALVDAMETQHGMHPRHELAVVAVCRALQLPQGTAAALFVLARIAGWQAHVLEQRLSNIMIRPRARFIQAVPAAPR